MAEGIAAVVNAALGVTAPEGSPKKISMGGFEEIFLNMQLAMGENMSENMMFPFMQLPDMQITEEDEEKGCMMASEMLFSEFVPCDINVADASAELSSLKLNLNPNFDKIVKNENKAEVLEQNFESDDSQDTKPEVKNFQSVMEVVENIKESVKPLHELKVSDETIKVLSSLKKDNGEKSFEVDGEVLQQPQTISSFEAASKKLTTKFPSGEELADQVQNEIKKNLKLGKNEFTVKLKPEGIGEIVVKLSEDKNSVSLRIFAASAETAKLITSEVASLQEALKPLNASVVQIQNIEDKMAFQFSGNADMGNRNQFSNQNSFDRKHTQFSKDEVFAVDGEEEVSYTLIEDDKMDTYI